MTSSKTRADILNDFTLAQLKAATIDSIAILDEEIALDGAPMIYDNICAANGIAAPKPASPRLPIHSAELCSETVLAGTNPENADYTNPTGAYYTRRHFIRCSPKGSSYHMEFIAKSYLETGDLEVAQVTIDILQDFADLISKAGSIDPDLWAQGLPIYGSDAWEEDNLDFERRQRSDEECGL